MMLMVKLASYRLRGGKILIMVVPFLLAGLCGHSQDSTKITEIGKDLTLRKILLDINDRTSYKIIFSEAMVQGAPRMNLHLVNVPVQVLLDSCFSNLPLADSIYHANNIVVYRKPGMTLLQGRVTDKENVPLSNATVSIKGSSKAVVTNEDGRFSITAGTGLSTTIEISYIGFYSQEIVVWKRDFLNIALTASTANMDAPVVIAYGSASRRLNTQSISEVKGSEFIRQPVDNIWAAMENQVPGLSLTQTSGVPGSNYNIELRGRNSIAEGNFPLVLLDGVPLVVDNSTLGNIGSNSAQGKSGTNPLSFINPADIESVVVLKDAAATAIYGSRGANGVILFTSKKGLPGKAQWAVDGGYGISKAINPIKLLNSQQYGAIRGEAIQNDKQPVNAATAPELVLWDPQRYTDFPAMMIGNTSHNRNVNIKVSGGRANTSYLASGSWNDGSAVFPGSTSQQRGSIFASVRHQSSDKRFNWDVSGIYTAESNHLPYEDLTKYIFEAPDAPAFYDSTGNYVWQKNGLHYINLPAQERKTYEGDNHNLFNHAEISYMVIPGLRLKTSFGYNTSTTEETTIIPLISQNPDDNPTGTYVYSKTNYNTVIVEPVAEYTRKIGQSHLDFLVGGTWQRQAVGFLSAASQGYTSDALLGIAGAAPSNTRLENHSLYKYAAGFARVDYNWREKYMLSLSGRRDGSSRFGPGKQFGDFSAVGAAWVFTKEPFLQKVSWLSFGKLSVSYGTTGNDQIGDYKFAQTFAGTNSALGYQGSQGVYPTNLNNNDLAWEVNHKSEAGIDLGVLHNRISLAVAYYVNRIGNQLVNAPLPIQTGFPGVFSNLAAVVENKGLEITLQTQNISSHNFHWSSLVTLSFPKNTLLAFPNLANSTFATTMVIGLPLNSIQGYRYNGVDPATGLFSFTDVNKDGKISSQDIVPAIASPSLKYYGGWNNKFEYKRWTLDLVFNIRVQKGANPLTELYGTNPPGTVDTGFQSNMPAIVFDHWRHAGDQALLQQLNASPAISAYNAITQYATSSAQVVDASFIRLKNIALSYRIPDRLLKKCRLSDGRLYLQGQNLWTHTRYPFGDPETQNIYALPPLRTIAGGIRIIF